MTTQEAFTDLTDRIADLAEAHNKLYLRVMKLEKLLSDQGEQR
jgi:two-component sensor histidine kinase